MRISFYVKMVSSLTWVEKDIDSNSPALFLIILIDLLFILVGILFYRGYW